MTAQRHRDLYDRFMHLHNVDRRRFDDCIQICKKEFYYANDATVMRILKEERQRRDEEELAKAEKQE